MSHPQVPGKISPEIYAGSGSFREGKWLINLRRIPGEKGGRMEKIPEKYRKRLMGLIPVERIVTWQILRPPKSLLQELLTYDGLTPTISDILDSMGIAGAIPGSVLRPVVRPR
jgi:hypothetical protein